MKNKYENFTVLYPECKNVCLIKDVGMIPYVLHINHNYASVLVTYKNEIEYSYLKEIEGVRLEFLNEKIHNSTLAGCVYLLKKARHIDVLQLYHLTSTRNFVWIVLFKLLNPKGKIYLKIDLDCELIDNFRYNKKGIRGAIKRKILSYCDLISSEMEEMADKLSLEWHRKVEYVPNGFYQKNKGFVNFEQKENIICTVGRIGTYQKGTDILLEGFRRYASKGDWKLRIIGEIDKEFLPWLQKFKDANEKLFDRITFTGNIEDRSELEKEYARAKIFCLPSRFESFGIVYLEAMRNGCYIISTRVDPIEGILKGKWGTIIPIDDVEELACALAALSQNNELLKRNCNAVQEYVKEHFEWNVIGDKIFNLLNTGDNI